ncbi:MAG: SusC/RagA family TonB-linked outer membrane protein [Bacteroidales bacterium]
MNIRYCLFLLVFGLVFCFHNGVIAQNISGKVLDMNGKPIYGATISSKYNSSIKALTDEKGGFEILLPIGAKLEVVTPDKAKRTVVAKQFNEIKMDRLFTVVEEGNTIEQSKFETTAATSTINSDEIMKSSSINAMNTIYGRGLGLTSLQNDGFEYDNNTSFNIRGLGSLQGNSPMILVDGFERPLSSLVKEEIESITVLKDAASLSLYGFRGSNGVVLVTTKKGIIGKTQIEFSYDHSLIQALRKPEFVNAYTYATAVNEARVNDGIATPLYNSNELAAFQSGILPDYYANVNWVDQVLKNNTSSNAYNISVRGGTTKVRYFTVMNLASNEGLMKPTNNISAYSSQFKFSRLNIRTNLDVQLSPTTNMSVKLLGALTESNRPGNVIGTIMTSMYNTPSAAFPVKTSTGEWGGSDTWTKNPVAMISAQGYGKTDSRTLFADWTISQDLSSFVDGLSAELRVGYDNYADYWESISQTYRYTKNTTQFTATGDTISNRTTSVGSNSVPTYSSSLGSQWRHFNAFGKIDYKRNWKNASLSSSLIFFHDQYVGNGQFSTTNRQRINGYTHIGLFDKYFVDLSLTGNGSNKLEPGHNIGVFPAIGSAWVLSREDFLKDVKAIDFLKLRLSYGVVGNDYTSSADLYKQTYGSGSTYYFTDNYTAVTGMTESRLATSGLTYEKSHKTNIGLDGRFWNAVDLTAEAFYEKRTDILVSTAGSMSGVIGATSSMSNDGIVENKGIELGLNINQSIGDLKYNIGGQFTYAKSKVVNQDEGFVQYDYLKQTGKPVGQIMGYESIGFFKDQADINASPAQLFSTVVPGDIKFKDQNLDNKINELDKVALGYNNICPEIYFSANVNLEYRGFGIDANFQGVAHYSAILNTASMFWPLRNNTNLSTYYYDNRWTPDNQNSLFPRLSTLQNDNNYTTNSVWVKDCSYIKLRTCELYYKLNEKLLAKSFLSKAKIYVRGMNLFSIDNLKVVDPESYGIAYPMTASFDLGVNIGF